MSAQFERPAAVDDILDEASRMRSVITDAVEDGIKSAVSAIRDGRQAAEDAIDDAKYRVKQNPLQSVALAFGAGVMVGALLVQMTFRRN